MTESGRRNPHDAPDDVGPTRLPWGAERQVPGRNLLRIGAVAVFVATFASSSTVAPGLKGDTVAYLVLLLFLASCLALHPRLALPRFPTLAFAVIYLVFGVNAVRLFAGGLPVSLGQFPPGTAFEVFLYFATVTAYVVASFVAIFLVPRVLDRSEFFLVLALTSAVSVGLGLLTYVVGDYHLGWIFVHNYSSLQPLREFDVFVPAIGSIWVDANAMSKVALTGTFGSVYLHRSEPSRWTAALVAFNGFGLFLGNSRAAFLAVVVAATIYVTYVGFGTDGTRLYVLLGTVGGALAFWLVVIDVGTASLTVGFHQRVDLWRGSIRTLYHFPFGVGPYRVGDIVAAHAGVPALAPQNSYLRVFVSAGLLGGVAYLSVLVRAVWTYPDRVRRDRDLVLYLLFAAWLVLAMADTTDPFGVNKNSIIFGSVLGYVLQDVYGVG